MRRFNTIFFDIVSFCNGRCPYCLSGAYRTTASKTVSPGQFQKTLETIKKHDLLSQRGIIGLYNWGEPFLHPQLSDLLCIINDFGFPYAFSTNASRVPSIDRNFVNTLDHILFSMPGFSQQSYDRIHGFNFPTILKNIERIVKECRFFGFRGHFQISYHLYQFNLEELRECEEFCNKWNITLNPYYAILNNWGHMLAWLDNTLPYDLLKRISQDLFLFEIERNLEEAPAQYACPQNQFLVLDEESNVLLCCQVPKQADFFAGNLLRDDVQLIWEKRRSNPVCSKCVDSGLAYYYNNALRSPSFYSKGMHQSVLTLKRKIRLALSRLRLSRKIPHHTPNV